MRPRITTICLLLAGTMIGGVASPATAADAPAYVDVEEGHWAYEAMVYTAVDRDWLRFGGDKFRPGRFLQRWQLARAAVKAYAPDHPVDDSITFTDLTKNPRFRYANVATSLGWFKRGDAFDPTGRVDKMTLNRVLVRALGFADQAASLDAITTEDGTPLETPPGFGHLILANELALNPNFSSPDDTKDLYPWQNVRRGFAAVAFHRAATAGWRMYAAQAFTGITLPDMNNKRKAIVEFAFKYAGYPYVYAGEWDTKSTNGSCCGYQPKGGFDCSGFQWWVMQKHGVAGFDNSHVREYKGWRMNQRRASLIAKEAPFERKLKFKYLEPGDLAFFATGFQSGTWRGIDHGGIALGKGWFIHSSGSRAGVTISRLEDGWWRDAFVMGRRLAGAPPA